jgi:hypothetical protein
MSISGDSQQHGLLEFLQNHEDDIPSSNFSNDEVAAIRALAHGYNEADAIAHVKSLARQFRESLKTSYSEIDLEHFEGDPLPTGERPVAEVDIDSCRAARIAVYKRNPYARISSIRKGVISLEAPDLFRIPTLDLEYGYKGGAARIALHAALGENVNQFVPRDLDLVRFGRGSNDKDQDMALEFMPEDAKYGHGVEVVPTYLKYLQTRDLTINEIVYINGKVICSPQGLQDCLNFTLRLTPHVLDDKGLPPGKVVAKMIRMLAEERLRGKKMVIADLPEGTIVTPFDLALHLDRALQKNSKLARAYLQECVNLGFLDNKNGKVCLGDTIQNLSKQIDGGVRNFIHLAKEMGPKKGVKTPKKGMMPGVRKMR